MGKLRQSSLFHEAGLEPVGETHEVQFTPYGNDGNPSPLVRLTELGLSVDLKAQPCLVGHFELTKAGMEVIEHGDEIVIEWGRRHRLSLSNLGRAQQPRPPETKQAKRKL